MKDRKLAVMQPYFFPYIGYFSLIKHVDEFILFDPVQYIRHGWIERNRILKQSEGWLYVRVPIVRESSRSLIKDIIINNQENWVEKITAQLQVYKKTAPHYSTVYPFLKNLLETKHKSIVSLNQSCLEEVCKYLGFYKELPVFSDMGLKIEQPVEPDDWALNISKALDGVTEYWNPPGGKDFFSREKYLKSGIELKFHEVELQQYDQGKRDFEAGLSIIDVLMFNSISEINSMLDMYELS